MILDNVPFERVDIRNINESEDIYVEYIIETLEMMTQRFRTCCFQRKRND